LFAIEVVLADVTITAFIPIMISAATGALVSTIVLNEEVLLSFKQQESFDYHNIVYYVILGLLAGFVSVYHARKFRKIEAYFARMKRTGYRKALYGAIPLAFLIFLFPTLFGEGYESIKTLANADPHTLLENTVLDEYKGNDWVLLIFIGLTMMLKAIATGLTLSSGGNGGNFAPSLFVGSYLGFFVAKFFALIGIAKDIPIGNFTIVGMAGILSGLFHAPLTAIFLIGEITGGYNLMVPLMIVSSVSFAVSSQFEKYSMDVKHLADKGDVYTSDKDKNILSGIDILSIINTGLKAIRETQKPEDVVALLSATGQHVFAIVDERNRLQGMIDLDSARHMAFNTFRIKHGTLQEITVQPPDIVFLEDSMETVMEKFDATAADYLPVLKDGRYFGVIFKQKLLVAYREKLKEMIID
jgi:CIC family chloride channel protein